ncbi:iron-sulfur cluster assembly scaffold protein [Rhodobacterales bacterium HKCCE2091]|nr:iron-sulfur cluster assembly scaffold protein [Rhodobacterales bacterium HKCCE2091]
MSTDADLIKLYSKRILALAADIPLSERLEDPQVTVKKRAPLCGSTVTVDLDIEDGRIARYGQDVKACALGQASAALMAAHVIGRTRSEIEAGRDALRAMLKGDGDGPGAPWEGYDLLAPARDYRNRHASILLSFEATAEAMAEAEKAACA